MPMEVVAAIMIIVLGFGSAEATVCGLQNAQLSAVHSVVLVKDAVQQPNIRDLGPSNGFRRGSSESIICGEGSEF